MVIVPGARTDRDQLVSILESNYGPERARDLPEVTGRQIWLRGGGCGH